MDSEEVKDLSDEEETEQEEQQDAEQENSNDENEQHQRRFWERGFWRKRQESVEDLDRKNSKGKGKPKPWDPEVTKPAAKAEGIPDIILPRVCPVCKKNTLFIGKPVPAGIRLAVVIALACVGAVNADKALNIPHITCMNSKCKAYYKRGDYFLLKPTGALERKKSWFHIDR